MNKRVFRISQIAAIAGIAALVFNQLIIGLVLILLGIGIGVVFKSKDK